MLKDFAAFILDLDGTLIDSEGYHARAFADAVLAQSGYALNAAEEKEFFGSHSLHFTEILNRRHGLSLDPVRVLEHKRRRVHEIFEAKPFQGALDFLQEWHGRKPMALATNSPLGFVMPALEKAGLSRFFDHITTADEVLHRKPSPEIIEVTLRKLGVEPLKTLVFEDQLIGIEAARAAGTHVVAVDNGQGIEFPPDVPVATWQTLLQGKEI